MADDNTPGPERSGGVNRPGEPNSAQEFGIVSSRLVPIPEPLGLPPIPLHPGPKPAVLPKPPPTPTEQTPKDTLRELVETVVFVVVLVLMLKTFLAEAFVIPTGSMADTLLGYHFKVTCAQCGYPNLVNASSEADPQNRPKEIITSCQCQNCGFINVLRRDVPLGRKP